MYRKLVDYVCLFTHLLRRNAGVLYACLHPNIFIIVRKTIREAKERKRREIKKDNKEENVSVE